MRRPSGFWKSPSGQAEILGLVEKHLPRMKTEVIASAKWWADNVTNSDSKLELECLECGVTSRPRIHGLTSGQGAKCDCKEYRSPAGLQRVLKQLASKFPTADVSALTPEYWRENQPDAHHALPLKCKICSESASPTIHNLKSNILLGCFCSQKVWGSAAGFRVFSRFLAEKRPNVTMRIELEEWLRAGIYAETKVTFECRKCNEKVDQSLKSLLEGHDVACVCTRFCWGTEVGFKRFHRILESHSDLTSLMSLEWWLHNVDGSSSKLRMRCEICKVTFDTTTINNFVGLGARGCGCRNWTERLLLHFLKSEFENVEREVNEVRNPETGRFLRYDFLVDDAVVIELDGNIGHFGVGWHGKSDNDVPWRDLAKEMGAFANNRCVLRLYQPDILRNTFDWKGFIRQSVAALKRGSPRVLTQDHPLYKSGIYAELRKSAQGAACSAGASASSSQA